MTITATTISEPTRLRFSPSELSAVLAGLDLFQNQLLLADKDTTDLSALASLEARKDEISSLQKRLRVALAKFSSELPVFSPAPKPLSQLDYLQQKIERGEELTEEETAVIMKEAGL